MTQTRHTDGNSNDAQIETESLLHEQIEFYRELIESMNLEIYQERLQRRELEDELRHTNQELYLLNQENQELVTAIDQELERSNALATRTEKVVARYNQLKAKFAKLEIQFNELGAKFIEFKAHSMARSFQDGKSGTELGIEPPRKDTF